jgi:hypothetical protein
MIILPGLKAGLGNLVGRGAIDVAFLNGFVDVDRPTRNLYDGLTNLHFAFSDVSADQGIDIDLQLLVNGDFEDKSFIGWTELLTSPTSDTSITGGAQAHSGLGGLRCEAGSLTAERYQDVRMRVGEVGIVDAWGKVVTSGNCKLLLQRIDGAGAGKYWNPATQTWVTSLTATGSTTSTSYTHICNSVPFTVENFDTCQTTEVTIRIRLYCDSGIANFDDVAVFAKWNFVAAFCHNLTLPVEVYTADERTFTSPTLETFVYPASSLNPYRPSFYGMKTTSIGRRFVRVKFPGTAPEQIRLAELVIGTAFLFTPSAPFPMTELLDWPSFSSQFLDGTELRSGLADDESRSFSIPVLAKTQAELSIMRDLIWRGTRGGTDTMVLVPVETEPQIVYGRLARALQVRRSQTMSLWEMMMEVQGFGGPVVGM